MLDERGSEDGLSVREVVLGQQDVGESGGDLGVAVGGGQGEIAAVGQLGSGEIGGGVGDLGGEEDVVGLLRGQADGGEQL